MPERRARIFPISVTVSSGTPGRRTFTSYSTTQRLPGLCRTTRIAFNYNFPSVPESTGSRRLTPNGTVSAPVAVGTSKR